MLIGCCKEIKDNENRVAITPAAVAHLVSQGHTVLVEQGAGHGIAISDDEFAEAGAKIGSKKAILTEAEMIVKVKEPMPEEVDLLQEGQILFTFLHLAASKELTERLLDKRVIGIGYETVESADGSLPILAPMSAIAGRLAPQVGAECLQSNYGGGGILLGGAPGVPGGEVLILGAGNVGLNAAKIACGMGAHVIVMGLSEEMQRLDHISSVWGVHIDTCVINAENVACMIERADLVISGVLVRGARAPKLINRQMLKRMKPRSVIVDVAVDQGGTAETTRPTTHTNPTYIVDNIIHYCVTNMPGIVAKTSTFALTNAVLPYLLQLAEQGINATQSNQAIAKGVNVFKGKVTNLAVARSLGLRYMPLEDAMRVRIAS